MIACCLLSLDKRIRAHSNRHTKAISFMMAEMSNRDKDTRVKKQSGQIRLPNFDSVNEIISARYDGRVSTK